MTPMIDKSSQEPVSAFVAHHNISLLQLAAAAQQNSSDPVLLVGSVAEGLATSVSDVDLLVVGARPASGDLVFQEDEVEQTVYRLSGGLEVNVEYRGAEELRTLAGQLEMTFSVTADDSDLKVKTFSRSDLQLMHRVRTGHVVVGEAAHWKKRFARLSEYLLVYQLIQHFMSREDAIGQIMEGDRTSALLMTEFAMRHLGGALLASVGETNASRKWQPKLLRRHQQALGSENVETLLCFQFAELNADAKLHGERAFRFADAVIDQFRREQPHLGRLLDDLATRVSFVTSIPE